MGNRNVLLIMSDQHSPKIAGFAGHPQAITPNLDRLAASGRVFENAYCTSPICVPARASVATGLVFRLLPTHRRPPLQSPS